MTLAPIVLFVYNRPWHTEQTLNALEQNDLADGSVLYIYSDGPKENAKHEDLQKIQDVRKLVRAKNWCKEVHIIESEKNKGLANSIIEGVTEIVNKHGKIIVLEDDIVTSKGFLKYMNDALRVYEKEERVFHISGYMYPHNEKLPEIFFFNVPLCWGWATWKRAWRFYNKDSSYLLNYFETKNLWKRFNKFGGDYLEKQLRENVSGKIKTWFIKWHASVLVHNGFTLYPGRSLVNNIGFDSSGVHNGTSDAFSIREFPHSVKVGKLTLKECKSAEKILVNFYDSAKRSQTKNSVFQKGKRFTKNVLRKLIKGTVLDILKSDYDYKIIKANSIALEKFLSSTEILVDSEMNSTSKLYLPYFIVSCKVGRHTYIAKNSQISMADIGSFCSIGPNFFCGYGIHPTNAISTSPMFYSTMKQNGTTLSSIDKVEERKRVTIGNDVFIGMNVSVLDGVKIGDGAVIGAGAVVSKDIPPYAIAVGNPIKILRYRFDDSQIEKLLKIEWWNFDDEKLKEVEKYFFEVDEFIKKNYV